MYYIQPLATLLENRSSPSFSAGGSVHLSPEVLGSEGGAVKSLSEVAPLSPKALEIVLLSQVRALRAAGLTHLSCWDPLYKEILSLPGGGFTKENANVSGMFVHSWPDSQSSRFQLTSKFYLLSTFLFSLL